MSIFGAIGSLVGGVLGNSAAKKRQTQMLRWQEQMDNTKIQRLQADAKKAGVHPLAAMGASLTSPAPVSVGGYSDFSDMGQNVGRALDATMTTNQKADDYTRSMQQLNLERGRLENDVLKLNLVNSAGATVNQAGNPPSFRTAGAAPMNERDMSARAEEMLKIFGVDIPNSPYFSPSSVVQNQWGEPAEWPYAFMKIPADLAFLLQQKGLHGGRKKVPESMLKRDREILRRKSRRGHSYYW